MAGIEFYPCPYCGKTVATVRTADGRRFLPHPSCDSADAKTLRRAEKRRKNKTAKGK